MDVGTGTCRIRSDSMEWHITFNFVLGDLLIGNDYKIH